MYGIIRRSSSFNGADRRVRIIRTLIPPGLEVAPGLWRPERRQFAEQRFSEPSSPTKSYNLGARAVRVSFDIPSTPLKSLRSVRSGLLKPFGSPVKTQVLSGLVE